MLIRRGCQILSMRDDPWAVLMMYELCLLSFMTWWNKSIVRRGNKMAINMLLLNLSMTFTPWMGKLPNVTQSIYIRKYGTLNFFPPILCFYILMWWEEYTVFTRHWHLFAHEHLNWHSLKCVCQHLCLFMNKSEIIL